MIGSNLHARSVAAGWAGLPQKQAARAFPSQPNPCGKPNPAAKPLWEASPACPSRGRGMREALRAWLAEVAEHTDFVTVSTIRPAGLASHRRSRQAGPFRNSELRTPNSELPKDTDIADDLE